ncbi:MFS transporter [Caldinitratiruptor microaerophilus]|nr:MFS transporter [Caldinitratiruptor microaerophilus]
MMRFPAGLRALRHRDFRLFWTGQLVSLVGTWMQSVGQSWLVLELTGSPLKLGLIGTLQFTPMLLFSLFAGAITDRLPKRRLILRTQTALMVLAFVLSALVWSGRVQYWHVAVLATLLGVVNTVDMPARQAFIVDMVGKEDLMNAIALNSAMFNGARIVGPAVAGLLVARYGVAPAFFLNGLSFLAVIAALRAIRAEGLPGPRRSESILEEIGAGLRYALRTPLVGLVLSLLLVVSVFVINYNVTVPVFARDVLGQEAEGFGLLMAALGSGALAGALTLAALGRSRPPLAAVVAPALLLSAAAAGMAAVRQFGLAAAVLFVMGYSQILFTASCNTTLQVTAPDELRGRVMSLYALVFAGVTPIGALFAGSITEAFGVATGFLAGGGLSLVSILALLAWWRARAPRGRPTPRPEGGRGAGTPLPPGAGDGDRAP